jgi:hypothetical protein
MENDTGNSTIARPIPSCDNEGEPIVTIELLLLISSSNRQLADPVVPSIQPNKSFGPNTIMNWSYSDTVNEELDVAT